MSGIENIEAELVSALAGAVKWLVVCDDPRSDADLRAAENVLRKVRGQ